MTQDLENTLILDTSRGEVVVAMRPDLAPRNAALRILDEEAAIQPRSTSPRHASGQHQDGPEVAHAACVCLEFAWGSVQPIRPGEGVNESLAASGVCCRVGAPDARFICGRACARATAWYRLRLASLS